MEREGATQDRRRKGLRIDRDSGSSPTWTFETTSRVLGPFQGEEIRTHVE